MGFFAELKRRNVFRVAAAYVVVSWVILQVAAVLEPALLLPEWFDRLITVLLLIGFPIALVLSWAFELTPEGVKRAVPDSGPARTGALDWVLAVALVVLIAFLGYREFSGPGEPDRVTADTAAASDPTTIIVLPFSDISPSGDQDFLAQGVSVELAKILVGVPGLSVLQLKGKNFDPATLGQQITRSYVLDGNVQRVGDSLQITAQLMSADNSVLNWADNYQEDFDVENLFAIQNKIAAAIAEAVAIPLNLAPGQSLADAPTDNTEAYQLYLRALANYRSRGRLIEAAETLVAVVAMEPEFAQAWALLAQAHTIYPAFWPYAPSEFSHELQIPRTKRSFSIVRHAARRAYELDPEDVDVLAALATSQRSDDTFAAAEDTYLMALKKDPNNPELLEDYAQLLRIVGRFDEALDIARRLVAVEPSEPAYQTLLGSVLHMAGDNDGAIAHWESGLVDPNNTFVATGHRIMSYFEAGRYDDAREALRGYKPNRLTAGQFENMDKILAALAAGKPPPPVDTSIDDRSLLDILWPQLGATEAFLEGWRKRLVDAGWKDVAMNLGYPLVSPARKTDGYKEMVTEIGLVDYWRERGWPHYCRPLGEDDFECE